MAQISVFDKNGNKTESIDLPEGIFDGRINTDVLHQAVVMYQAALRQGNASTKERADVSGGGKKPYRQKGTGQSRAGSSRSPLWKGGGVTFGPHPRDFKYAIPKKIRRAALRESLKAKCQDNDLFCVADINDNFSKTKEFAKFLNGLSLSRKVLAVLDGSHESIPRVSRNLPLFNLKRAQDVNAYDILRSKKLLISKTAFQNLLVRLKNGSTPLHHTVQGCSPYPEQTTNEMRSASKDNSAEVKGAKR